MTTEEVETEILSIAECLRDHAKTDPSPANLRKVVEWAAGEIDKLAAALNTGALAG